MIKTYKLTQPILGWAKGEILTHDSEWGVWTRKKTGESFDTRGSIGEGEVVMLLNYLAYHTISFLAPTDEVKK